MTSATERPLLFLDVDGPLIPFGPSSGHAQAIAADAWTSGDQGNPLLTRLDPELGARLTALGCHLVWATTWMAEANEVISPRIGLPSLPMVEWPASYADEGPRGLHWKTRQLVEWANGRPFIWVDDEISAMDRLWVDASHSGPSLLHRVDPAKGLLDTDFAALADWLRLAIPGADRRVADQVGAVARVGGGPGPAGGPGWACGGAVAAAGR
ncbi:HAD domain-containing protein [Streptomyces sp. Go-475]|uniref:HAD domain-containing protein n=1 Tax=Streptomyces sp. Go-475 TaxID=2072505 RepID=UPI0013009CB8|nr:HAD domain-containing protein [Streptomyces sp. Go-475]